MRRLVIVLALLVASGSTARADGFGIGLFVGDPTGLDLNIGLQRRSALDIVLGLYDFRDRGPSYAHLTYLVTPVVGHGETVRIPLRLGIGGAVYGNRDDVNLGVRVPLELGIRFRTTPLEIYGEIALLLTVLDANDAFDRLSLQGGIGLRFYF